MPAARGAWRTSFLSAVADRFGLWGPPGAPGVAWGDFAHFLAYTQKLTHVAPALFGWSATIAETGLGLALVAGFRLRLVATLSGALLASFAVAMAISLGPKAPLDHSVFTAAAAAFLLGSLPPPSAV